MSEAKASFLKSLLSHVINTAVTGSVVFAIAMATIAKQTYINANDIKNSKEAIVTLRTDMTAADARSDATIAAFAKLSSEQIQQTRELITLLRVQNRLGSTP